MELFETILITLIVGAAAPILAALVRLLLALLASVVSVTEQAQISALDRLLAKAGWCSARRLGPGNMPADGYHFLFLRGPILARRSTTATPRGGSVVEYTLYAFGRPAIKAASERLLGDPRDVTLRYVYAPAAWRTSAVTMRAAPPCTAYAWQKSTIAALLETYGRKGRAAALVCGGPGTGKSTLGELLAVAVRDAHGSNAEVIKNLDLTSRGLLLEDVFDTPSVTEPVVLMLDEFDAMVDHAERADRSEKNEGTCLADSPTSLLALLDRLNRMPHLVVLATTNRSLAEMTASPYARYTRAGRLDAHFEASL